MAAKCYCLAPLLADGTCRYKCPAEADPRLLRAQARQRKENDRRAAKERQLPTLAEMHAAIARAESPGARDMRKYWTKTRRRATGGKRS